MKAIKFSPIYGNNIGDVAISIAIEHIFFAHGISVESHDILFRPPLSFKRTSKNGKARILASSFLQLKLPRLFSLLKKGIFLKEKSTDRYKSLIEGFDFVIFGGGNLLMSKMGSDYGYRVASFAKSSATPTIIFSCGAGPFLVDKGFICSTIVEHAAYISVRDLVSLNCFRNFPPHLQPSVTIDPAFVISEIFPAAKSPKRDVLGLNIISNFFSEIELLELAKNISQFSKSNNLKIRIINTAFPSDEETSLKFSSIFTTLSDDDIEIISLKPDLSNLASAYGDLKMFFGCRMHSLIFALSYQVPTAGFCWDEKVRSMLSVFLGKAFHDSFILTPSSDLANVQKNFNNVDYSAHLIRAKIIIFDDVLSAISTIRKP
jgi:polysaccharide pyruvyl transferase WcaK-like protein